MTQTVSVKAAVTVAPSLSVSVPVTVSMVAPVRTVDARVKREIDRLGTSLAIRRVGDLRDYITLLLERHSAGKLDRYNLVQHLCYYAGIVPTIVGSIDSVSYSDWSLDFDGVRLEVAYDGSKDTIDVFDVASDGSMSIKTVSELIGALPFGFSSTIIEGSSKRAYFLLPFTNPRYETRNLVTGDVIYLPHEQIVEGSVMFQSDVDIGTEAPLGSTGDYVIDYNRGIIYFSRRGVETKISYAHRSMPIVLRRAPLSMLSILQIVDETLVAYDGSSIPSPFATGVVYDLLKSSLHTIGVRG